VYDAFCKAVCGEEHDVVDYLVKLAQNKAVVAVASIVFGLVLVVQQAAALDSLVSICGYLLLASAAVYAILYATGSEKRRSYVVIAVILGLIGLFIVVNPRAIVNIFPTLVGIILLVNGIVNYLHAYAVVRPAGHSWTAPMVLSIAVAILGLVMILAPGLIMDVLVLFMGIALLVNGAVDLAMMFIDKRIAA
jgi:uncharacterized membrane protein HdeD (DUF308 family)